MSNILIAGGSGMIGRALTGLLIERGHQVIVLTRRPGNLADRKNISLAHWNPATGIIDTSAIQKADYIINLAGADVGAKRWTAKRKQEIADSRVLSGALLAGALKEISHSVKAVVQISGIGWYGPDPVNDESFKGFRETDAAAAGFLGETSVKWEGSIDPVLECGVRLVKLRTGVVLSNEGGALKEFKRPLLFGIAAILGTGRQVISWIHIEDICRIFLHVIENEKCQGVYNAVAPVPVSIKEFMLQLAKEMRGNFYLAFPVPDFLLKIIVGELSIEVLKSARIQSEKIRATGFEFKYPDISTALRQLI